MAAAGTALVPYEHPRSSRTAAPRAGGETRANNNETMQLFRFLIGFLSVICAGASAAQAVEPLPEPLTLEQALALAEGAHPELVVAESGVERAQALRARADALDNWRADLDGRLQWVDPSPRLADQRHEDHQIGLVLSKPLYDFGRTDSALAAADSELRSSRLLYNNARTRHRIAVMEAYFDVLLADLAYSRDNEAMATAFVAFDRQRDRQEQGKISDIEVLQAEAEYQRVRSQRYASDVARRSTRARLALLLNRPGKLPATLVQPELPDLGRKLPEVEHLQDIALAHNPELAALRERVEAARARLQGARADKYPIITGEMEAAEYARDLGSSDRLRVGIHIRVPLYQGGAVRAEVAHQQAEMKRAAALRAQAEMDVRQAVLDQWQRIYVLRARRDQAQVEIDYRDLYLDRSRALYELNIRTDLGDSMVRFSAARYDSAKAAFDLALAFARLEALLGQPIPPAGTEQEAAPAAGS